MKDALIAPFLQALGSKVVHHSEKFAQGPCPLAHWRHAKGVDKHPSFGVGRGTLNVAKCFTCGFTGTAGELVWRVRAADKATPSGKKFQFAAALELLETQLAEEPLFGEPDELSLDEHFMSPPKDAVVVFPEHLLDAMEDAWTETEVHPYLASRAVDCNTARRLDLRWDAHEQRIVFPIRDLFGRLCGLHGRCVHESDLPYRVYRWHHHSNAMVALGEHWLDYDKTLVMVESVFDLAAVYPVWPNVVCPRTANFPDALLRRLDGVQRIVTMFDNDAAGDVARRHVETMKGVSVSHVSTAPYKDPGKMPQNEIEALLSDLVQEQHIFLALPVPF